MMPPVRGRLGATLRETGTAPAPTGRSREAVGNSLGSRLTTAVAPSGSLGCPGPSSSDITKKVAEDPGSEATAKSVDRRVEGWRVGSGSECVGRSPSG